MVTRISDPRILDPDPALALVVDLLLACVSDSDLDFMFAELSHIAGSSWRIPVDQARALHFEWVSDLGAFNIRLE